MKDIEIKDMDIISWYDYRLLNTFKYKSITKLSDIINCTKLLVKPSDKSDTENIYQGFRDLVLYRYCNIPHDNNIVLESNIIFDDEGWPIGVINSDIHIYYLLHRLGLGYWDEQTVRYFIKNNYDTNDDITLKIIFNDIVNNKFPIKKDNTKIVLMLKRRIQLILESSEMSKDNNYSRRQ